MTIDEIKKLIAKDETRTLELKKTTGELHRGMETACAFLNSEGWMHWGLSKFLFIAPAIKEYCLDSTTNWNLASRRRAELEGYKDELKPVFKSTPTQFQTIIYATTDSQNVGDLSEIKLTERQQHILNIINESPTITAKKMSEALSVSQRSIERDISELKKKGIIQRDGKDRAGVWVVVK